MDAQSLTITPIRHGWAIRPSDGHEPDCVYGPAASLIATHKQLRPPVNGLRPGGEKSAASCRCAGGWRSSSSTQ